MSGARVMPYEVWVTITAAAKRLSVLAHPMEPNECLEDDYQRLVGVMGEAMGYRWDGAFDGWLGWKEVPRG